MGNAIADLIGFVAAAIGGFAFRDEFANAANFSWQRLGTAWRKARLWYLHSVAARTWWLLMIVGIILLASVVGVYDYGTSIVRTSDKTWWTILLVSGSLVGLAFAASWVWLLPAFRIRDWFWVNDSTDELNKLARRFYDLRDKYEDKDEKNKPALTDLEKARKDFTEAEAKHEREFFKRHGYPRTPFYAILTIIFGPIVVGVTLAIIAAYLGTVGGAAWYEAAPIAGIGFFCYVIGEIMLRIFSSVLESVLGDAGDAANRIANAVLIRPGFLVLPFITEQNYEKLFPKPIEVPFKRAAEAVKGATLSIRAIFLTVIVWAILLPEVSILGVVLFAGIVTYGIVVFHEYRKLDFNPFVEGSSRLHAWFMKAVMFFRIIQLVIYGLWRQWWSGDLIWNSIANWCNDLLGDGGFNWLTVGLVLFGSLLAWFFAERTKVMKHQFMINTFRGLTAFFGLVALLPLVGWALALGNADTMRLPTMPSSLEAAQTAATDVTSTEAPTVHPPDTIDRMAGGTATSNTPPVAVPVAPVVEPLPVQRVEAIAPSRDTPRRELTLEERCRVVSERALPQFRDSVRARLGC